MRKILTIVALLFACVGPILAPAAAQTTQVFVPATAEFPALTGRVVDDAGVLDNATREALRIKLQALEEKTGDQLIVVTVKSLHGSSVEEYANKLFRHWRIGEKGRNNGVLFLHAPNERKIRFEVGYGLEGTLTDAISKLIQVNAVAPRFKQNDFNGGTMRGVDDIIAVLSGDESFKRKTEVKTEPSWQWPKIHVFPAILFGFFGLLAFYLLTLGILKLLFHTLVALDVLEPHPRRGFWNKVARPLTRAPQAAPSSSHGPLLASGWGHGGSSRSWSSDSGSSNSSGSSDSFSGGGGGDSGGGGASSDY